MNSPSAGPGKIPVLFNIERHGAAVVVRRLGAAYKGAYVWGAAFSAVLLIMLAVYIRVARTHPGYWGLAGLVFIIFLALAARAQTMARSLPQDVVTVDPDRGEVVRNGEVRGEPRDLESVVILEAVDGAVRTGEMALLLQFKDTRHELVGRSVGLPGEQHALTAAARDLSVALSLPVTRAERLTSEWWLDQ
jgi:hypothetical protein